MSRASLESIYKEVKSVNQRLDFLEDLVEEVVVNSLPRARLTKNQKTELKKRLAEMKPAERATLEDMKRA